MKHILLASGGVDSTLIYFKKKEIIDDILYFDYGHRFKDKELKVIKKLYGNKCKIVKIEDLKVSKNGFFYGRNLKFFITVRELYPDEDIMVYFGHSADDNFSDNTRYFLYEVERVINHSYPNKTLRIITPLENMTKKEIWKELLSMNPPVLPWFCDYPYDEPCGKCHSCKAMKDAGIFDEYLAILRRNKQ